MHYARFWLFKYRARSLGERNGQTVMFLESLWEVIFVGLILSSLLDQEFQWRDTEKAARNSEYVSFDSNFALIMCSSMLNPEIVVF